MTRRPDGGNAPSPITDSPTREFWPAGSAERMLWGANKGAGLPGARYQAACRQQYRNALVRWGRHYCAAGLRIVYTNGALPESVRLTLLHAPGCPRGGA